MNILFISHDATRTGAPTVLLRLIRWLRANTDVRCSVLLGRGGPLRADFAALAAVEQLPRQLVELVPIRRDPARRLLRAGDGIRIRRGMTKVESPDLIYSNTVMNGRILAQLRGDHSVVSHVHELEPWMRQHVAASDWRATAAVTTRYIAVSEGVRAALGQRGVPEAEVRVIPPFLEVPRDARPADPGDRRRARATLGLPDDAFLIGGGGALDWSKGPELFVQAAQVLTRRQLGRPVHFVWLGGGERLSLERLRHDCHLAGLEELVHFVGEQTSTDLWFAAFDVLALTSRADAYPLVMLENSLAGNPVVCFSGSGGAPDFAASDAGVVVPYLDLDAFADALERLCVEPEHRQQLGMAAFEKARTHDVAVIAPRIYEMLIELAHARSDNFHMAARSERSSRRSTATPEV